MIMAMLVQFILVNHDEALTSSHVRKCHAKDGISVLRGMLHKK